MKKISFIIVIIFFNYKFINMETVFVDLEIPDTKMQFFLFLSRQNTRHVTALPIPVNNLFHPVNSFSQFLASMRPVDAELLFYENDDFIDTLKLNSDSLINYYVYSNGNIDSTPRIFYGFYYNR